MTPHYLREYRKLMRNLQRKHDDGDEAYEAAVGGNYIAQGKLQAKLVLSVAPDGPFNLLDIGCGSGRAAYALRNEQRISYIGAYILPELLDYARKKCARGDWRFELLTEIAAPAQDDWADAAMFMSVFTHLKPAEIKQYLAEAARALKPGGVIICSYLNRHFAPHKAAFRAAPLQWIGRLLGRDVMLSYTTREELAGWLEESGFSVEKTITYETARQHVMIGRRKNGPDA